MNDYEGIYIKEEPGINSTTSLVRMSELFDNMRTMGEKIIATQREVIESQAILNIKVETSNIAIDEFKTLFKKLRTELDDALIGSIDTEDSYLNLYDTDDTMDQLTEYIPNPSFWPYYRPPIINYFKRRLNREMLPLIGEISHNLEQSSCSVDPITSQIRKISSIKENDLESLLSFAETVEKLVSKVIDMKQDQETELKLLKPLVAKLPVILKQEWAEWAIKDNSWKNFGIWIKHVRQRTMLVIDYSSNLRRTSLDYNEGAGSAMQDIPGPSKRRAVDSRLLSNDQGSNLSKIVPVILRHGDRSVRVLAMIDEKSLITVLHDKVRRDLEIEGSLTTVFQVQSGSNAADKIERASRKVTFDIKGMQNGCRSYRLEDVRTVNILDLPRQEINLDELIKKYPDFKNMNIKNYIGERPKLLIGMPHSSLCTAETSHTIKSSKPSIVKTQLGMVLCVPKKAKTATATVTH